MSELDIPPPDQVGAFWDAQARRVGADGELAHFGTVTKTSATVALRDRLERAHLDRLLQLSADSRVLDLGGGAGRIALWLAPRVAEVTLVDVSRELLNVAERTARARGIRNLRTVCKSALDFVPDGRYDAVLVMGVCCHLNDAGVERMVDICDRALGPGGRLYLKEPVTTDGIQRVDEQNEGGVPYRVLFRPRELYAALFERRLDAVYQQATCAHLLPFFVGGTQQAAAAAGSPLLSRALTAVGPALVRSDPLLQRIEQRVRANPALAMLLAKVPVLHDLYVFEKRSTAGSTSVGATTAPELSVVVIAFNEQECIATVVRELRAALDRRDVRHEIVLVDDGSRDDTLSEMHALQREDARTHVVPLSPNRGIGGALRAGFDASQGRYVTWVPADGQIGPEVVLALFAARERAPMTTTVYRSRDDAWYRHVISSTLNRMITVSTGQQAKSGGNYLFARSLWQRCAPRDDDSMMLSSAFRANARAAGERIDELEIDARARVAGRSKVLNPKTILRTLQGLGRMKEHLRR
jgi:2-polyprenyl-3-methyl-5-hydroxy-6-metoxy-1,4-benzoquinol methylase